MLIDSHCHIQEANYPLDINDVISRANQADVMKIICVGTNQQSSIEAIELSKKYDSIFASVGVHPHFATEEKVDFLEKIVQENSNLSNSKLVAIGEIGLDYYYDNSPHDNQKKILIKQIEIALKYNLPIIFHVRNAYDDFWPIIDKFISSGHKIRGVLHSFTDTLENAKQGINRGLYIGINGISTFTKDESQKIMYEQIPVEKILLETDAPLLTPSPLRGKIKINEPAFIRNIAEYNSAIRQINIDKIADITTINARALFKI